MFEIYTIEVAKLDFVATKKCNFFTVTRLSRESLHIIHPVDLLGLARCKAIVLSLWVNGIHNALLTCKDSITKDCLGTFQTYHSPL